MKKGPAYVQLPGSAAASVPEAEAEEEEVPTRRKQRFGRCVSIGRSDSNTEPAASIPLPRHEMREALEQAAQLRQLLEQAQLDDVGALGRLVSSATASSADTDSLASVAMNTVNVRRTRSKSLASSCDSVSDQAEKLSAPQVPAGFRLRDFELESHFWACWVTPDARTVGIAAVSKREVQLWDLLSGTKLLTVSHDKEVYTTALSPDGNCFCSAGEFGLAMFAYPSCETEIRSCSAEELRKWRPQVSDDESASVHAVAFSTDGIWLAAARGGHGVVEVFEVQEGELVHQLPAFRTRGGEQHLPDKLCFSDEWLAVVGGGTAHGRQVQLFSAATFDAGPQIDLPEAPACVAFSQDGRMLAVGLNDGTIHVYKVANLSTKAKEPQVLVPPFPDSKRSTQIRHVRFDSRGAMLFCSGQGPEGEWNRGGHWVIDLGTGSCVRRVRQPENAGTTDHGDALAISPAGDIIVIRGRGTQAQVYALAYHALQPISYTPPPDPNHQGFVCVSPKVAVFARGSTLTGIDRVTGDVKWSVQEELRIGGHGHHGNGLDLCHLSLRKGGQDIAYLMEGRALSVRNVESGKFRFKVEWGAKEADLLTWDLCYSRCGAWLVLMSHSYGIWIYSADTGEPRHRSLLVMQAHGADVSSPVHHLDDPVVACTTNRSTVEILSFSTGKKLHTIGPEPGAQATHGVRFDHSGTRVAYIVEPANKSRGKTQVVVCRVNDWQELHRVELPWNQWSIPRWSPGDEFLLVVCADSNTNGTFAVVRVPPMATPDASTTAAASIRAEAEIVEWSAPIRAMIPPGNVRWSSIEWVQHPDEELTIQIAVDDTLCFLDVASFINSFERDGNFSVKLLCRMSDVAPESVAAFVCRFPFTLNRRDPETGETVLDYCVRTRNHAATKRWLLGPKDGCSIGTLKLVTDVLPDHIPQMFAGELGLANSIVDPDTGGTVLHHLAAMVVPDQVPNKLNEYAELLNETRTELQDTSTRIAHDQDMRVAYLSSVASKLEISSSEVQKITVPTREKSSSSGMLSFVPSGRDEKLLALIERYVKQYEIDTHNKMNDAEATAKRTAENRRVAVSKWLSSGTQYVPRLNLQGHTALRVAIDEGEMGIATVLAKRLCPLPKEDSSILVQDLVRLTEKDPRKLVSIINALDDYGGYALFREIREIGKLKKQIQEYVACASDPGQPPDRQEWPEYYEDGISLSVPCGCKLEVLALRGFVGSPIHATDSESGGKNVDPPYTLMFAACEAQSEHQLNDLMQTKLMIVATLFKWNNLIKSRIVHRLCKYLVHFVLVATAMLVSTQISEAHRELHKVSNWTSGLSKLDAAVTSDLLHAVMLLTNTWVLRNEVQQAMLTLKDNPKNRMGAMVGAWSFVRSFPQCCIRTQTGHFLNPWNLCDILGVVAVYTASAAHFANDTYMLQQVGSLGVLLNAFSFLQMLAPFETTGPLITTVSCILHDISGFMYILCILLWGFSAAFTISMPDNSAFDSDDLGPVASVLTSYKALLGSFNMTEYDNPESRLMFLVFLFAVVIVMLNLLIAIMSDSYEMVKDSEVVEARKLKAKTIIAEERLMSEKERRAWKSFPDYLLVLTPTGEKEAVWGGMSGQISDAKRTVLAADAHLSKQIGKVHEDMKARTTKIEDQYRETEKKLNQLVELASRPDATGGMVTLTATTDGDGDTRTNRVDPASNGWIAQVEAKVDQVETSVQQVETKVDQVATSVDLMMTQMEEVRAMMLKLDPQLEPQSEPMPKPSLQPVSEPEPEPEPQPQPQPQLEPEPE